MIKGALN